MTGQHSAVLAFTKSFLIIDSMAVNFIEFKPHSHALTLIAGACMQVLFMWNQEQLCYEEALRLYEALQ